MARLSRVVVAGVPHHITQRGNRRQTVFFSSADYAAYLKLMAFWCKEHEVEVLAYCLMSNHVHLVAVPGTETALARAIGEAHRRYTVRVNQRENWRGYLFQGRFSSCPMDERYLLAAVRYVELNPVRAGLVEKPWQYSFSSARAHIQGRDDRLVKVAPMLSRVADWRKYLLDTEEGLECDILRRHTRTGRPLGDEAFTKELEAKTGRKLLPKKRGRRPKAAELTN